jgi:hypothetical protein
MNIQEVINQIAAGDSAAAKEGIENVLSAKAFDALQGRKQEIAATLFGGQEQEHEEVTDDEEAYAEEVEHDGEEQLDEVSMGLASAVYRRRKMDAHARSAGFPNRDEKTEYKKSGEHKISTSEKSILKKPGGARRLNRIDSVFD